MKHKSPRGENPYFFDPIGPTITKPIWENPETLLERMYADMKPRSHEQNIYLYVKSAPQTKLGELTNCLKQKIELFEDPVEGQDATVIALCEELKIAAHTDFWDTHDLLEIDDYEPSFLNGKLTMKFENQ